TVRAKTLNLESVPASSCQEFTTIALPTLTDSGETPMRKTARHSVNETQQTLLRPVEESEKICDELVKMSLRLHKPMSEEYQRQLLSDLGCYPVKAIEYALDSWGRNAKVLPTLADLLQLLNSWMADKILFETCGKCDTGWIEAGPDKAGNRAVQRCECVGG